MSEIARLKTVLTLAIVSVALYLLVAKTENGPAREVAMWLLGALMGYWFR
jgi:hypothetical protein